MLEESLVKKLMTSMKCGVCGQSYELDNIDVLGHEEGLWFLKIICSDCQSESLVAAIIEENRKPEVITELTKAELDKFKNLGMLTGDDILDMHDFLKDFNGDFSRLFHRK